MQDPFEKFKQLYWAERYDEALYELKKVPAKYCPPPNVLIIQARCILLGSGTGPYEFNDATSALARAIEIDPEHVEALNDSGYHYLYMLGDTSAAKPYFEKARSVARVQLTEAIAGMAECAAETSPQEALDFIEHALKDVVDMQKLGETVSEIKKRM